MRISDWSSDVCSSDLAAILVDLGAMFLAAIMEKTLEPFNRLEADDVIVQHRGDEPLVMRERNEQAGRRPGDMQEQADAVPHRSEEHTSELQSLMRISYAVFCLKKKKPQSHNTTILKN